MALKEEFERQGAWLFRWRSYLPLCILPLLAIAMLGSEYNREAAVSITGAFPGVIFVSISFAGLLLRCLTIGFVPRGTSGRNTKRQKAVFLNTTGMYSLVRHPLYLANFIIFLGAILYVEVWWFTVIFILSFWLYYERIMFTEEEFLRKKFDETYLEWASKIPAFIPKISNWKKPAFPFSFKYVLKREYPGFFGIVAAFTALEIIRNFLAYREFRLGFAWIAMFIIGALVYLTLRLLKKKTNLLKVSDR